MDLMLLIYAVNTVTQSDQILTFFVGREMSYWPLLLAHARSCEHVQRRKSREAFP